MIYNNYLLVSYVSYSQALLRHSFERINMPFISLY